MIVRFGQKLRHLRHERQISQTELSRRLGLSSHAVLSNLEVGRKQPSLVLVAALAHALGATADYLLRDDLPVSPPILVDPSDVAAAELRLLGAKVRQLRARQGLTQAELAERLGLTTNAHLSYIENAKKEPSLELVLRISDALGVTADYLLRDDAPVESAESSDGPT